MGSKKQKRREKRNIQHVQNRSVQMLEPLVVTMDQATAILGGISRATIYNWERDDPEFPRRRKLGGRYVFMLSELREYIAKRPTGKPPRPPWLRERPPKRKENTA